MSWVRLINRTQLCLVLLLHSKYMLKFVFHINIICLGTSSNWDRELNTTFRIKNVFSDMLEVNVWWIVNRPHLCDKIKLLRANIYRLYLHYFLSRTVLAYPTLPGR